MKKHILLGLGLCSALASFSQGAAKSVKPSGIENTAQKIAQRFEMMNRVDETAKNTVSPNIKVNEHEEQNTGGNNRTSSITNFTSSWNAFTGSMNAYGVVYSSAKPLHYNEQLNAVSFVHRRSNTYLMSPVPTSAGALAGGIVAMVSGNWGNNWDSTLLWNNNTQWARYPQGGLVNPTSGNTNLNNAYVVAMGPVVDNAGSWNGNFFASKPVGAGTYNNIASTVTAAQQFIANTAPFTGLDKTDFAYDEFTTTDNGIVHALGQIADNVNPSVTNYRGARVVKGVFNSGTFVWSGDSIIPNVTSSAGSKNMFRQAYMAWNQAGTVGYVVHIGCRANPNNLENSGYQPIISKTTDGGATWVPVNGIDFTQPTLLAPVLNHLYSTRSNSNVTIPFFNFTEGIAVTVDNNNDLHIVSTLMGASSAHPDSLGYTFRFNNADGESYKYAHVPGIRPYIYDFIGGANPAAQWKVLTVDSMSSEVPGNDAAEAGYSSNPWLPDGTGAKVLSDARIQTSRTADGKYIVYTFAESDTAVTLLKWNSLPNIKARLLDVNAGTIHPNEINVTRPTLVSLRNPNVASRAFFHFAAPVCALAQTIAVGPNGPAIVLPMTVSNSSNLDGLSPVAHRYSSTALNFGNVAEGDIFIKGNVANPTGTVVVVDPNNPTGVGIAENSLGSVQSSFLFPNPAKNDATLSIGLKDNSTVEVSVLNVVGQVVSFSSTAAQSGQSNININLNGLSKGIYMVNVKVDNAFSTKKLIIE